MLADSWVHHAISQAAGLATKSNDAGVSYPVESGPDWAAAAPGVAAFLLVVAPFGAVAVFALRVLRRRSRGEEASSGDPTSIINIWKN